jgi:HlyD family secretion protein
MARRLLQIPLALAMVAGFLFLVYLGLTWDLRDTGDPTQGAFHTEAVARGKLDETVVATGALEPFARVVIQSEIPGVVARVLADEGERVARGQPLVELERERLEDRAVLLRAQLAEREARARFDLVGRARAELDQARRAAARARRLREEDILSAERLEDLEHAVRLAEIGLTDAHAERAARLAAAEQARRALQRAERDLELTVIRSPVDGVLVARPVEVGTAVADIQNGGTVVAELADDRRIHMKADVDENEVARLRIGQRATVRIDAFPDEAFEGRVRRISSSGESEGSIASFEVEIELAADPRVRVGMSADARIAVARHADVLLVPNRAILRRPEGPAVRRIKPDRPDEFELVRVGEVYTDGFQTVVDSGVREGDRVVVRADP